MKYLLAFVLTCCALCAKDKPPLKFGSISLFDDHRKKVCAAYMKAAAPIYTKAAAPIYGKGEAVTDKEKTSFTEAAKELVRLRDYVGTQPLLLSSKGNESLRELNQEKLNDYYAKMLAAEIKTDLPATREELNEASKWINALGQLMQLPVMLN